MKLSRDEIKKNIISYLRVFAKNLGILIIDENLLNDISEQIIINVIDTEFSKLLNIPYSKLFEQVIFSQCKKCRLRYIERGSITSKEYQYCIKSNDSTINVPNNCPLTSNEMNFKIEKTEDDQYILD